MRRIQPTVFLVLGFLFSLVAQAADELTLKTDPLRFNNLVAGKAFTYNVRDNVEYSGAETLRYSFSKAPSAWLELKDGILSGTPTKAEEFTTVVKIEAGSQSVETAILFVVTDTNKPPVLNQAALSFNVKERGTFEVDLHDPAYVSDDGETLSFELSSQSDWAKLTPSGKLTLNPKYPQVGLRTLLFKVSDGSLSTSGSMQVKVPADPRVPVWDQTLNLSLKIGEEAKGELSTLARDLDGRKLTFSKVSGENWLGVTGTGTVFGTAKEPAGDQTFTIRASNGTLHADKVITVSVSVDNYPPRWLVQEISLTQNPQAGEKYEASINDKRWVTDPDGDPLTFSWVSGPAWAAVSPDGKISGTPPRTFSGPSAVRVAVADPKGASAEITVRFSVDPVNAPPVWIKDQPIALGEIPQGKKVQVNIASYARDPLKQSLTFSLVRGPAWMKVEPIGLVEMDVAATEPLGAFTAVIGVSDGKTLVDAAFVGTVTPPNHPPEVPAAGLAFSVDERRTYTLDLNRAGYVTDADKDKLTFALLKQVSWATLTSEGVLTLTPTYEQIGAQALDFRVTDNKDSVQGVLKITVKRVPRPPHWREDKIVFTVAAGLPFTKSIRDLAEDLDGLPIEFALKEGVGPDWLNIQPDGTLYGTPSDEHVGDNGFIAVVKNDARSADVPLILNVTSDNSPPAWKSKPVNLVDGRSGTTYFASLKNFAVDADASDFLTFSIVNDDAGKRLAPAWADITTSGLVFGNPREEDVGVNSLTVRVTDSRKAFADVRVQIKITSKNNAPKWETEAILLGNAKVGTPFSFSLSRLVTDADGDELHFIKESGPGWLRVGDDGTLGGRPLETDVGEFVARFGVTDNKETIFVDAAGKVEGAAKAPVIHADALKFSVAPGQVFEVELAKPEFVENPEQGALKFEPLSSVPWVVLEADGTLKATPAETETGTLKLSFRVSNRGGSAQGEIQISLDSTTEPPFWLVEPVALNAVANTSFEADLKNYAKDSKELPLKFKREDQGAAWVTLREDGLLTGRPTPEMSGTVQKLRVSASNGLKSTPMDIEITVAAGFVSDEFSFESSRGVPKVEILFVLDHSGNNVEYYESMKASAGEFLNVLSAAKIQFTLGVLSSRSFLGSTVLNPSDGTRRLLSSSPYLERDFVELIERSRAAQSLSSPIWSLDRFFVSAKLQPSLNGADFYQPGTPSLVFVHTQNRDDYQTLSQGTGEENASVEQVAIGFSRYHRLAKKPFRLYINDMSCDPKIGAGYSALVQGIGGQTVTTSPCQAPFLNWLPTFGDVAVARAKQFSLHALKLSQAPRDPAGLKVLIRKRGKDYELVGNTGKETDQWVYDAKAQAITLQWWNIRGSVDIEKDSVLVRY